MNSLSYHTLESSLPSSDLSFLGLYQDPDASPFGVSISDTDWLQSPFSWKGLNSQPSVPCAAFADELSNWNSEINFSIDVASNVSKHQRMQLLRDELVRLEATL